MIQAGSTETQLVSLTLGVFAAVFAWWRRFFTASAKEMLMAALCFVFSTISSTMIDAGVVVNAARNGLYSRESFSVAAFLVLFFVFLSTV